MMTKRTTTGRRGRRGLRAAVALTTAALVLAACGGSGESETDNGIDPSRPTIKIGVIANITGPSNATDNAAVATLTAWANEANRNGGIGGNNVELAVADNRLDTPTIVSSTQKLIDDPSVVAVVSYLVGSEAAVSKQITDAGLPVIGGIGYNAEVWGKIPGWFGLTTTIQEVVTLSAMSAKDVGATVAVSATCAESAACAASEPLFKQAAEAEGIKYEGNVNVATSAPNFTAECLEFKDRGADLIRLSSRYEVAERLASDCVQQGYEGWFGASAATVSPVLYDNDWIRLAGAINAFPWFTDAEPIKAFREIMDKENVDAETYGQPSATAGWVAGKLFEKVLANHSGPLTRESVMEAYYSGVKNETLDGLLPMPFTFVKGQPAPLVNCGWLFEHVNGEFSGAEEPTCA
jgi:branched-chain amino acid transport system substrate-binding protein